MQHINFIIGILFLILGIPVGQYLAKITKEELKAGTKWFKFIVFICMIGIIISLIIGSDALLFSLSFIAIVTSQSLKEEKKKIKKE